MESYLDVRHVGMKSLYFVCSPLRQTALIGVLTFALATLLACTPSSESKNAELAKASAAESIKTKVIGFSQIGAESAWRSAETKSIQDEAKKRGYDLRFSDAQQKQENQIKAIRTFIAQKVDAIVLAPVVETGWEPVLR